MYTQNKTVLKTIKEIKINKLTINESAISENNFFTITRTEAWYGFYVRSYWTFFLNAFAKRY
jgi:hypothetical protein